MATFIVSVLKATAVQIIGLFGIFFALGYLLSKLQEWTQKNYFRSVGWKGILWTAWIGTPIHESGHFIFAKIFRHKIIRFGLFQPNEATGELGHLDHSFSRASLYQKIGNFFIGAAPMIFGSLALALLTWLAPNGGKVFIAPHYDFGESLIPLFYYTQIVLAFVRYANTQHWYFWLFLYISFAISSHLAPSKADRKTMWSGLRWILGALLLINIFAVLFRLNATTYLFTLARYITVAANLFVYALFISFAHWVFSLGLRVVFRR